MQRALLAGLLLLGASACDSTDDTQTATAAISPPTGVADGVSGTVTFTQDDDDLDLRLDLRGASPGEHGVHVHAVGSCEPGDTDGDGTLEAAGAAMGHYDPLGTNDHGAPTNDDDEKHAGDLGNVTATTAGVIQANLTTTDMSLSGTNPVAGRAFMVHAGRDDLETDPGGNSGTRVGCGIIGQPTTEG